MMSSRLAVLALVASSVPACGGSAPPAAPGPAPAVRRSLDLAALARSIDPGRVQPLPGPPQVLADAFKDAGGDRLSEEQLAAQTTQLAHSLTRNTNLSEQDLGRVLALAYLGGLLERRLGDCDLDCLARAEQAYAALDIPWLAQPEAFLNQLLGLSSLMQRDVPEAQGKAALEHIRAVFARAPVRHRQIAADILRRAPRSEAATNALRSLALRAEREGDYQLAVRLRQAVIERVAPPSFDDLTWLAGACVLAGRLPCVERAIDRAARVAKADPARIADLKTQLASSRRIATLARSRRFEQRLERAHLLVDVGRRGEAVAEFDALQAAHPRDARPVAGRARTWFEETRSGKAMELVTRARELEHKDRHFYELAVGLTFERLMGLAAAGGEQLNKGVIEYLPELRGDVDGLARFVPGIGGVLQVVVGRLQEGVALLTMSEPAERRKRLSAITRAALADAIALRQRHPREPNVYRLIFLAARFGSAARDYAAASTEIPTGMDERDDLLLMQAGLLYSLAVSWRDGSRAGQIKRALDALSPAAATGQPARLLRADTLVLEARLQGKKNLWPQIATAYRELVADAAAEDRARLHNNLGVALWETGDRDGARAAWAEAITAGDPNGVAQLNSTVASDRPDIELLERIAENSGRIGVRVQALRWKVARARLKKPERRAALQRVAQILATSSVDDAADGSAGVVLEESFNVGVGYSTRDRLLVKLFLGRAASLLLPAPVVDEAPRDRPRKNKSKKKKRKRGRR